MVVQHGIEEQGDDPFGFRSPSTVNTIYGRWWHPADDKAGKNPVENSPLEWTGEYEDGLGNPIRYSPTQIPRTARTNSREPMVMASFDLTSRSERSLLRVGHGLPTYKIATAPSSPVSPLRFAWRTITVANRLGIYLKSPLTVRIVLSFK